MLRFGRSHGGRAPQLCLSSMALPFSTHGFQGHPWDCLRPSQWERIENRGASMGDVLSQTCTLCTSLLLIFLWLKYSHVTTITTEETVKCGPAGAQEEEENIHFSEQIVAFAIYV